MKRSSMLSLGAIAMDTVFSCTDLPRDDGFSVIRHEEMVPGGSASNVSVAAASLGMRTLQAGKIGDDEVGRRFRETLVADGVDDTFLITEKGRVSLHTYIVTAPGGKHCIFANPGDAITSLSRDDLPADILENADIFYTDLFSHRAGLPLAEEAKSSGKPVVYNMQCVPSFMELFDVGKQEIEQMLAQTSLFVSNREGFRAMTGESDSHVAVRKMYERYPVPDGVVCTTGADGAVWCDGRDFTEVPGFRIDPVDTTGAGDAFIGGLIFAYYGKVWSRAEALSFAAADAALNCLVHGARSRSDFDTVQSFRKTQACGPGSVS